MVNFERITIHNYNPLRDILAVRCLNRPSSAEFESLCLAMKNFGGRFVAFTNQYEIKVYRSRRRKIHFIMGK